MANNLKKGDIVMAAVYTSEIHNKYPQYYPPIGTVGKVLGQGVKDSVYVQWSKGSTSLDDKWYAPIYTLRKLTKRDISLFVKYYDKYMKTTTTSVKQYYKCPSKAKRDIEEYLLSMMKSLQGYGYKVLGGNSQRFIAAFMVNKILHVYTSSRQTLIDTVFAKEMSDKRKEELETLEVLENDAFADTISGD